MCGLVGYIGKNMSRTHVVKGLSRLEYRGYDSAGFACINRADNRLMYIKTPGQLENLLRQFEKTPIDGHLGVGHTRWSTHGQVTTENAHPLLDCTKRLSIFHNGIIENHRLIKETLISKGHVFESQTDTETIAHLLEDLIDQHKSLKDAITALVNQLEGAYALACISQDFPNQIIAIRKGAPLCIGIGDQEFFIASDIQAFMDSTQECIFMPDKSFALLDLNSVKFYNFLGQHINPASQKITGTWTEIEKQGYEHFMLKEIYEQKNAISTSLFYLHSLDNKLWDHIGLSPDNIRELTSINLIGCGTSWHAGRIAQFFFETIAKIPASIKLGSEFRYMPFFPADKSLYVFISQSGETADTLEALKLVNNNQLPTLALTNISSSTIVREAQGFILTHAGTEVAVASTKAFSTQIAALFWLAHRIALEKGIITKDAMLQSEDDLLVAAEVLENSIENYKHRIIETLAPYYAQFSKYIFLGRHISYPFAMEAALKLKEISYIFAQCYPAGELKHGPLALIDKDTPVFIFSALDQLIYQKLLSNAQEVKARNGHLAVFAFEGQDELIQLADTVFILPHVNPLLAPLAMTGLMQFFVYHIAKVLNCPIDKPRNLAKSVTVE